MSKKQRIKKVSNSDDRVVDIAARSPNTLALTGVGLGRSTIVLTGEDGSTETYRVIVTPYDIQELKRTLKRTIRSGNIEAIPTGSGAVVLTGFVDCAEDLTTAAQIVQAEVGGASVINNLRVGGVQQVQLDVVVAQVSRNELRNMAFNFLASSEHFFLGSTVGQAVANPPLVGLGSNNLSPMGVLSGAPGTPGGQPTNFFAGVLHNSWGFLKFLQALRTEGIAKLVAKPRLVTKSGRQASFLSGGEQAIPVPAGLGQVGVQFEEFGTRLNFVPIVLCNGRIHLEVEPEVSSLDPAAGTNIQGTIVPGRSTQRVRTTVEMEVGQTFVIGGLIQRTVNASTIKVPILGDLPFIGSAFSTKSHNEVETEVLIMVTPYLVDPLDCTQLPKYLPGQETRSPDDFELFLEGILEAPRGQREVFQNGRYVPAYKNDPSANLFPCNVRHQNQFRLRDHATGHSHHQGCSTCSPGVIISPVQQSPQPLHKPVIPAPTIQPLPVSPKVVPPSLTPDPAPKVSLSPRRAQPTPGGRVSIREMSFPAPPAVKFSTRGSTSQVGATEGYLPPAPINEGQPR